MKAEKERDFEVIFSPTNAHLQWGKKRKDSKIQLIGMIKFESPQRIDDLLYRKRFVLSSINPEQSLRQSTEAPEPDRHNGGKGATARGPHPRPAPRHPQQLWLLPGGRATAHLSPLQVREVLASSPGLGSSSRDVHRRTAQGQRPQKFLLKKRCSPTLSRLSQGQKALSLSQSPGCRWLCGTCDIQRKRRC